MSFTGFYSRISKVSIFRCIVYAYIFSIPFSHAPSIIGPYITLPFLMSTCIIVTSIYLFFTIKKISIHTYFHLVLLCILIAYVLINTLIFNSTPKPVAYIFAYLWFPVFVFSLCFLVSKVSLDYNKVLFIVVIGFILSFSYNILELTSLVFNKELFYIPRYDRELYKFYSPLGFRVRGFNYESGNYGFYINVCFIFLYSNIKKFAYRILIIIMAAIALLLSFSSFHLVLFLFLILPYLYLQEEMKLKFFLFYFLSFLLCTFLIYITNNFNIIVDGSELIFNKFASYISGSGTESGEVRNQLLYNAIDQISIYPIFGQGLSSFYYYQNTGYNNIYLQVFQQLGIFGGLIFFAVVIYPCVIYFLRKCKFDYKILIFLVSMLSMWFIGDFWVPQLFIFYLLIANDTDTSSLTKG